MNDPCFPYMWFVFEAVIPISTFIAIPQIPVDEIVFDSEDFSTNLKIEVYKKLSPSFGIDTPKSRI
jgi:hypothetical protein